MDTWLTDFRADLPKIDVPVLLIHGDPDRILPYPNTAARLPGLIKDLKFVTVEGGPHNMGWTFPRWSTRRCSTSWPTSDRQANPFFTERQLVAGAARHRPSDRE